MGIGTSPLRISTMDGENWRDVEATVDTGAFFTMLRGRLLRDMGVVASDTALLEMAERRRVEFEIGRAWATIDGKSEVTVWFLATTTPPPCWAPILWRVCA